MEPSTTALWVLVAAAMPPVMRRVPGTAELAKRLVKIGVKIAALVWRTWRRGPTATNTRQWETELNRLLMEFGRSLTEWLYNMWEPSRTERLPGQFTWDGETYRRDKLSPNRFVGTLFGEITLWRVMYRPVSGIGPAIFPLELALGLVAGRATPALAERVAQFAVDHGQRKTLGLLKQYHGVGWGVKKLRDVLRGLRDGLTPYRHQAMVAQLLKWLRIAYASSGSRKPVLSVGSDGVFLPIRNEPEYKEGATATISVLDRRGDRVGTLYLGQMPEAYQKTLYDQLTRLINDVLIQWEGSLPRLAYVTDAGFHPTHYYNTVLKKMVHPRTGEKLEWQWIVDYYHACLRITKLAEVIFGAGREAQAWAAKMRKVLKEQKSGIHRVLHSAAALRHKRGLVGTEKDYHTAYNYLSNHLKFMDYFDYRRQHLPIGSGITEAACKTVFTERFKRAGMSWEIESGQVILDLRTLERSGIWGVVFSRYLSGLTFPDVDRMTILETDAGDSPARPPLRLVA